MEDRMTGTFPSNQYAEESDQGFRLNHATLSSVMHPMQHLSQGNSSLTNRNEPVYSTDSFTNWHDMLASYPNHHVQQSHLSTSSQFSHSTSGSCRRFTEDSVFSRNPFRDSAASDNTTYSHLSDAPREYNIAQAERRLNSNSSIPLTQYGTPGVSMQGFTESTVAQRQTKNAKDKFSTCGSRVKRSRPSAKEPRYWCTSCEESFGEKYDWIVHEVAFQERPEMFMCDMCEKTYFLAKDYRHHHRQSHRCQICAENETKDRHTEIARKRRKSRTAWGCGFCEHFDVDWDARCAHVASHFERGATMTDWHHTRVIFSLLQRPGISESWYDYLVAKRAQNSVFGWNQHSTGRAKGFPDGHCAPQLQDLLEFFTPDQDPLPLVVMAYEKGNRGAAKLDSVHYSLPIFTKAENTRLTRINQGRSNRLHSHHSPQVGSHEALNQCAPSNQKNPISYNKDLPMDPIQPPVPPKDIQLQTSGPALENSSYGIEDWDRLITTISEDDSLPDSFVMNLDQLESDDLFDVDFAL
ncbi:hypothetical protein CC78DRAFT_614906 [Lojkania enalia]|uniref:C2H2-type domain-containing protein n=1 Tax=Lojkania enalia TaxID=147567 RepID=A0A9P4KF34_9PLEO|nr:hypothetical protein CC78DRAFT_614906 [Didymosphaeria enalia]